MRITISKKDILLHRRHVLLVKLSEIELQLSDRYDKGKLLQDCADVQEEIDACGWPSIETDVAVYAERAFEADDELHAEDGFPPREH